MPRMPDAAFESTAAAYDATPYRSICHPQTRPAHLAAIAHLLGITAPAVATARVLEIGCASGGNLIPLAATFPEGRFVGVDLSPVQIGQATQRAAAAGLGNVEFRAASVTDVDQAWGTYDYIVCHGVYSWVPKEVRRAILRVIAERLADDGLAMVSYNVLPGWHLKRVARDIMLLRAGQLADPVQKVALARSSLDYVKEHAPLDTPYGQVVAAEADFVAEQRDYYLLHEYLETENNPCTVLEFLAEAEAAGVGYLADSDTVLPETLGTGVAAALRQLAGDRLPRIEHYLDLAIGRTFRQSILMKPAAMAGVQRTLDLSRLGGLHVSATFARQPDPGSAAPFVFTDRSGRSVTTASAAAARGLAALAARWPSSAMAGELSDDAPAMHEALFELLQGGVLTLSSVPVRVGGAAAARPVAWPLARVDALQGALDTANPQHMPVELDAIGLALLPLIDGTRDRAALADPVMAMVQDGRITLRHDGKPIDDPKVLRALVERIVEGTLQSLASVGLLMA